MYAYPGLYAWVHAHSPALRTLFLFVPCPNPCLPLILSAARSGLGICSSSYHHQQGGTSVLKAFVGQHCCHELGARQRIWPLSS